MAVPAVIEWGDGPAVLLVHGLNGFKEGWGPLPEGLAGHGRRVVAVDLPGFGATPRLRGRTTPPALADALEPLVERLAPTAIVGHSLGSQVAMILAARRPDRVARLALVAPWVLSRPMRIPPKSVSDVVQVPIVGPLLARIAISRIRRSPSRRRDAYLTAVADRARITADPGMARLLQDAADRLVDADLRAMADWAASGLGYDVRSLAGRVVAPTLVVRGMLDRVTKPPGAEWLAGALPAGSLLSLDDVAHFPHLEAADRVVAAIADHLA